MTPAEARTLAQVHCEQALTPLRPRIRQLARALLVRPRQLPYGVAAAIADSA